MRSILIVHNISAVQNVVEKFLKKNLNFFEPEFCTTSSEALKRNREKDFDIIISDYILPDMTGREFLKEMRNSGKKVPFIFLIEKKDNGDIIEIKNDDLDYFLINNDNPGEQVEQFKDIISNILLKRAGLLEKDLNEAKYRSVIESMDDSIYMVDNECRYLFMNNKHFERISRSADFFKDRKYGDFHSKEESLNFSAVIERLFTTGDTIEEIYEKGGRKYIRTLSPVKDINDEKTIAANVISKEIPENEEISGIEDSIYIVDQNCRYLSINASHMERLAISCEEIFIGKSYDEFHPGGKNEKFSHLVREVFETGEILSDEYESGNYHFARRFCPVMDTQMNRVVAVTIVSTNITDQKITEKSLIEANKKLNLLSSITRHDILNQMTVLLGYLELSHNICQDEEQRIFLEKQKTAAETIYHQISFTKDYQEIGVHTPAWQEISDLIEKSVRTLNPSGIIIENRCEKIKIFAEPLLEKVFYNLIDNSIRHGEKVTKISFYTEKISHGIILVCEDNGAGIKDEDKDRIFKQGYGKNTGLGLFLIREILSITGLEIHETGAFGEGAKFVIAIPDLMHS